MYPLKCLWCCGVCNWVVLLLLFARFLSQIYFNALASKTAKTEKSCVCAPSSCCVQVLQVQNFAVRDSLCANFWFGKIHTAPTETLSSAPTLCYMVSNFACCHCQLTSHLHAHTAVEPTLLPLQTAQKKCLRKKQKDKQIQPAAYTHTKKMPSTCGSNSNCHYNKLTTPR